MTGTINNRIMIMVIKDSELIVQEKKKKDVALRVYSQYNRFGLAT